MKFKSFLVACTCLWLSLGLTACTQSGANSAGNSQGSVQRLIKNAPLTTGSLQGVVRSELTDLGICQVYLYNPDVTAFADMYDSQHADFIAPNQGIVKDAPLAASAIDDKGMYQFSAIGVGQYQLVLGCIATQGVQDESALKDDPIQYNGFTFPNPNEIRPNVFAISITQNKTTTQDFIDTRVKQALDKSAAVVVFTDMTDANSKNKPLHDVWQTVNRITPKPGVSALPGLRMNTIRMIGGVNKRVNGNKVPDLAYDIAHFNEQTQQYEYDFRPLVKRIDTVVKRGYVLHQLVVDQPPWAFQRGHVFIPDEQAYDGTSFKESQRVSHYGNSLPPKDKKAYNQFLQAMMRHLIDEYGRETVAKWRFRIGTEIETPDHWFGTEQDFVEHFGNSAKAIRAVLPEAIIGVHSRGPNFIYRNGSVTNYKGEAIKSFTNGILEYSDKHNIKIDFWGVSDYPFINLESTRDPKSKYAQFFKPLIEHPLWQADTVLDIEEFSVITRMGGVPGTNVAFIKSYSPHADTFSVALTDEFYRNDIHEIFLWGYRKGSKRPFYMTMFENMFGSPRISSQIKNVDGGKVENIGAVVTENPQNSSIQAVTYHYDPADLEAINERDVQLVFVTQKPVGSKYFYRKRLVAPKHHEFYSFMKQPEASSWLRTDKPYFSVYGSPSTDLNDAGKVAWDKYQHQTQSIWSDWQQATTVARADGAAGSEVKIASRLPLFSYEKTEIKW